MKTLALLFLGAASALAHPAIGRTVAPTESTVPAAGTDDDRTTGIAIFEDGRYGDALPYLQREAKAGHDRSLVTLAYLYRYGKGTAVNYPVALNLYNRGMERGIAECYLRAGEMHEEGQGVKKDAAKALALYRKAADMGSAEAEWTLGDCYYYGRCGLAANRENSIAHYDNAARKGFLYERLAEACDSGMFGPGRETETFYYYTLFPTTSYTTRGRLRLARLYAQGIGTEPDADRALAILKTLDTPGAGQWREEAATLRDSIEQTLTKTAAEFPGGMTALAGHLARNIKYPTIAAENGKQGTVLVAFTVKADGSVADAHIERSVDPFLDREALRVVNTLPKFQPAKSGNKPVDSTYKLPVRFRLK